MLSVNVGINKICLKLLYYVVKEATPYVHPTNKIILERVLLGVFLMNESTPVVKLTERSWLTSQWIGYWAKSQYPGQCILLGVYGRLSYTVWRCLIGVYLLYSTMSCEWSGQLIWIIYNWRLTDRKWCSSGLRVELYYLQNIYI